MPLRFTRLTRPAVRKLQAGERITEHGITAEGLKDGDVRYSVNVMVDGERIHRVVGRESDAKMPFADVVRGVTGVRQKLGA